MLRQLGRQERGQSIIIISLAMVAMIAMLALILDAGYVYAQRRLVQNAADAAALAAVREVATGTATDATVQAKMEEFAQRNSPLGGVTVTGVYLAPNETELALVGNGSLPQLTKGIRVEAQTSFNTFFMGVIGITSGTASAKAMAKFPNPIGPGNWAIWVGGTANCASGALGWNASSSAIYGSLHSNSNVQVGGGGGGTTIHGNVESVGGVQGPNLNYGGTVAYPIEGIVDANPYRFRLQDYQPGGVAAVGAGSQYYYIAGDLTRTTRDSSSQTYFDGSTRELRSGLYYVTGNVNFTGGVSGTVAIIARGVISIKGGENYLALFQPSANPCALNGIVLFTDKVSSNLCSDSGNVIELSGQSNTWSGIINAPNGRVSISGSKLGTATLNGTVSAQTVDISGANLTIRYTQYCGNQGLAGEYLVE